MAPITKHLHSDASGSSSKPRHIEEEYDLVVPFRKDVLEWTYKKILKAFITEEMDYQYKFETIKSAVVMGAEQLKMSMREFSLLLNSHIGERPDRLEATDVITIEVVDKSPNSRRLASRSNWDRMGKSCFDTVSVSINLDYCI